VSFLKGNYPLENGPAPADDRDVSDRSLEEMYYRTALAKLGGSIAFVLKDKTFLWTGDDQEPSGSEEPAERTGTNVTAE
jgi:hypothetical protein